MSDSLACNWRFHLSDVIDDYSRECMKCIIDTSLSARQAIRELSAVPEGHGLLYMVVSVNHVLSGAEASHRPVWPCPRGAKTVEPSDITLRLQAASERLRRELWSLEQRLLEWSPVPNAGCSETDHQGIANGLQYCAPHNSLGGLAPVEFTKRLRQGHMDAQAQLSAACRCGGISRRQFNNDITWQIIDWVEL